MGGSWVTRSVMGDEIKMTRSVKRQQTLSSDKIKMMRVRSRERQRWASSDSRLQAAAGFRSQVQALSLSLSLGLGRLKMGVISLKVKQKCKLFYISQVDILWSTKIIFRLTEFFGQSKHAPWCKIFFIFLLQPKKTQPLQPCYILMINVGHLYTKNLIFL